MLEDLDLFGFSTRVCLEIMGMRHVWPQHKKMFKH